MPTPAEILEQLHAIANHVAWLAIAWHVVIVVVAVALIKGWRPQARTVTVLVVAPVLSVSVVSASFASWFNAVTFGVLAVICASLMRDVRGQAQLRPRGWRLWVALALIAYGFVYPHFVDGGWYRSSYASPVGLVPCPTLALVAGFALLVQTSRSRVLCTVLAGWTVFYALFGVFQLGVWLDVGLLLAVVALVFESLPARRRDSYLPNL